MENVGSNRPGIELALTLVYTEYKLEMDRISVTTHELSNLGLLDLQAARVHYLSGGNVTEFLRTQLGISGNTPEIIEAAYDLQAGSYVSFTRENLNVSRVVAAEMAAILTGHLQLGDRVLDIGTGELTTLSFVMAALPNPPSDLLAFDISWSRLRVGLDFAKQEMPQTCHNALTVFCADINAVPLADKSVDVTISNHALEPNGAALSRLLAELLRITRRRLVLFEPCREMASPEGQARMDRLGYIRDLIASAQSLGAQLLDCLPLANPLNPTAAFVLAPPGCDALSNPRPEAGFTVPGTSLLLCPRDDVLMSNTTGLCFPVLRGIPILRLSSAVLASAFIAYDTER